MDWLPYSLLALGIIASTSGVAAALWLRRSLNRVFGPGHCLVCTVNREGSTCDTACPACGWDPTGPNANPGGGRFLIHPLWSLAGVPLSIALLAAASAFGLLDELWQIALFGSLGANGFFLIGSYSLLLTSHPRRTGKPIGLCLALSLGLVVIPVWLTATVPGSAILDSAGVDLGYDSMVIWGLSPVWGMGAIGCGGALGCLLVRRGFTRHSSRSRPVDRVA